MTRTAVKPAEAKPSDVAPVALEIAVLLRDLTAASRLVDELVETRQRGLGFATAEAKEARASEWLKDRRDRAIADQLGQAHGSGPVATPGSWPGLARSSRETPAIRRSRNEANGGLGKG